MADTPYTPEDLEKARSSQKAVHEAFGDDTSNNPNKFRSAMKSAAREVRHIEASLKEAGAIPLTEQEQLERELDRLYPDAPSRMEVEYNGKKYKRWYFPAEKSNSGKTVKEWDSGWREIP